MKKTIAFSILFLTMCFFASTNVQARLPEFTPKDARQGHEDLKGKEKATKGVSERLDDLTTPAEASTAGSEEIEKQKAELEARIERAKERLKKTCPPDKTGYRCQQARKKLKKDIEEAKRSKDQLNDFNKAFSKTEKDLNSIDNARGYSRVAGSAIGGAVADGIKGCAAGPWGCAAGAVTGGVTGGLIGAAEEYGAIPAANIETPGGFQVGASGADLVDYARSAKDFGISKSVEVASTRVIDWWFGLDFLARGGCITTAGQQFADKEAEQQFCNQQKLEKALAVCSQQDLKKPEHIKDCETLHKELEQEALAQQKFDNDLKPEMISGGRISEETVSYGY